MCCRGARLSVAAIAVAAGRVDGPLHTAHGSLCQLPRRLAGHRFLAALLGCCWSWVTCVGQACACPTPLWLFGEVVAVVAVFGMEKLKGQFVFQDYEHYKS